MADRDYELREVLDTYRRDGSMVREKARVLVEDWLDRIYPRMTDDTIPTSALLEIGKTLIELGDLKPKKDVALANQGPGFSITINIPQSDGKAPITIEGTATPVEQDEEDDFLAALPTHVTAPGFDLDDDLVGHHHGDDA